MSCCTSYERYFLQWLNCIRSTSFFIYTFWKYTITEWGTRQGPKSQPDASELIERVLRKTEGRSDIVDKKQYFYFLRFPSLWFLHCAAQMDLL